MEIISGTTEFYISEKTAVAIGKFDGIHKGHRRLLEEILRQKENGLKACVFTFNPPPEVLFGKRNPGELTTVTEKREYFDKMGIDILIEFPLTLVSAAMEPEAFVTDILKRQMNASFIAAGNDLSFGARGRGNAVLLNAMSSKLDFELKTISKVCLVQGIEVSSTLIRTFLEQGRMDKVKECLGEAYQISGKVVHGNRIGHTIGFPTANIIPPKEKLLPPYGVYFTKVYIGKRCYLGLSNIGCKPTVSDQKVCGLETYLYDFDEDIYGESICVELHHFNRPELRFRDLEELKQRIYLDMREGRAYWNALLM